MRKNMAKMAAALLSAALVVTSMNIPGSTSEAATAKISVAKKTLYAGGPSSRKRHSDGDTCSFISNRWNISCEGFITFIS